MSRPDELKLRKNGYWYAQWYDDAGKRRTKSFGHQQVVSRDDATRRYKRFLRNWERSATVRRNGDATTRTIEALVAEFLAWARGYYRRPDGQQTGEAEQLKYALVSLEELFGDMDPQDFTPKDLEACQQNLVKTGIARTTINGRIRRIRQFFGWLTKRGEVKGMAEDLKSVGALTKGRTDAKEPKPLVPVHRSEVDAVFSAMPQVVRDMVEVQWQTGMRSGELVIMRACDIDMTAKEWVYEPPHHKTKHLGKVKRIPIGPRARAILEKYLTTNTTAYLFSPADAMRQRWEAATAERKTPLSCGNSVGTNRADEPEKVPGERYNSRSYRRAVIYACDAVSKAAGIPEEEWTKHHWTPYQLRRACASRLTKDYGKEAARVVLGHSDPETTERYITRDVEEATRIMGEAG